MHYDYDTCTEADCPLCLAINANGITATESPVVALGYMVVDAVSKLNDKISAAPTAAVDLTPLKDEIAAERQLVNEKFDTLAAALNAKFANLPQGTVDLTGIKDEIAAERAATEAKFDALVLAIDAKLAALPAADAGVTADYVDEGDRQVAQELGDSIDAATQNLIEKFARHAAEGVTLDDLELVRQELTDVIDEGDADISDSFDTKLAALRGTLDSTSQDLQVKIRAAVAGLIHGVAVLDIAKAPKAADADGAVYIVDSAPTAGGVFDGHANQVASKVSGAWTFKVPADRETHLNESDQQLWTWNKTQWVQVGSTGVNIPGMVHAAVDKAVPVDADELALVDLADTFKLKKLSWSNLRRRVFAHATPYGTFDNDAAEIVAYVPAENATYRIPWSGLKTALAKVFPKIKDGQNLHNEEMLHYEAASSQWVGIDKVDILKDAITVAPQVTTVTDTMQFALLDGTNAKIATGPQLKDYIGGGPTIIWLDNAGGGTTDSAVVTLPAGENERHINLEGWIAPSGSASAYPTLIIRQGTANVALQANLSQYGTITQYTGNQVIGESTFTGTSEIRMCQTGSTTTHMKGNDNAYFTIKLYRTSDFIMVTWDIMYRSQNSTNIHVSGFSSGAIPPGNITGFGIQYMDSAAGTARPVLAVGKCEVHH